MGGGNLREGTTCRGVLPRMDVEDVCRGGKKPDQKTV